jgi:hypothetical protein
MSPRERGVQRKSFCFLEGIVRFFSAFCQQQDLALAEQPGRLRMGSVGERRNPVQGMVESAKLLLQGQGAKLEGNGRSDGRNSRLNRTQGISMVRGALRIDCICPFEKESGARIVREFDGSRERMTRIGVDFKVGERSPELNPSEAIIWMRGQVSLQLDDCFVGSACAQQSHPPLKLDTWQIRVDSRRNFEVGKRALPVAVETAQLSA